MAKRYKITIEEIGQEVHTIGKKWELGAGETSRDFGYTPETEATREYQREVYQQTVDTLDMSAVVAVVNGLSS